MRKNQLSITLACLCGIASLNIAFVLLRDLDLVYNNALGWSGSSLKAIVFVFFIASALVSAMAISILIYLRSRSWFLVFLVAHVLFAVLSWPAYLVLLSVLVWWFSKYIPTAN